jgi:hypothetical protein
LLKNQEILFDKRTEELLIVLGTLKHKLRRGCFCCPENYGGNDE